MGLISHTFDFDLVADGPIYMVINNKVSKSN